MASETFYCPHCKTQLTKSAQMYVLCEMHETKSRFMGFGEISKFINCANPFCKKQIITENVIKGSYDSKYVMPDWIPVVVIIASIAGFIGGFYYYYNNPKNNGSIGWSVISGILIAIVANLASFIASFLLYFIIRLIKPKY